LIETPIKAGCPEEGIVLDPFMGSGTTALVALQNNRKFIGIELNPEYIEIAEKRIEPLINQATLLESIKPKNDSPKKPTD
jgi:DNA modification methylase